MENLTGKLVDRYQILELLGKGGMAMVYKARDTRLEREVALKIIRLEAFPPEQLHDVFKRFEREAKASAGLSHPNIVKVLDYGEYEGSPFLVLEYLPGGTLKQMIDGPRSWQKAMQLLLPVARGLEYAHQRGIAHRDIKPANILLTENGEPTLSDFGIVKLFQGGETTTLTASGAAVGTPEYMAPEQWTGEAGPKSDMYALGIILYEIITGQRPYDADTPGGLFLKQVTEPLPPPGKFVRDLPEPVERFLLKALDKEPSERHDDLGAFIREIESLLAEDTSQTQPVELEIEEKAAREKAEREAAEKAAREREERQAAEQAAREKAKREAAEKASREKAEREVAEKAVQKKTKKIPKPEPRKTKIPVKINARIIVALVGLALVILVGIFVIPLVTGSDVVYFTSNRDGKAEIYKSSGGKTTRITTTSGDAESWSPSTVDADTVYFTSNRDGKEEIYKLNGGQTTRLTFTGGDAKSWSPSAAYVDVVYFTSNRDGKAEIYKLNDGKTTQLTFTGGSAESWSPSATNADVVYFVSNRDGKAELYKLRDGITTRLTFTGGNAESWAPSAGDTDVVYFVSDRDGKAEIYKLSDGETMRLTFTGGSAESWAPLAVGPEVLYFTSNRGGKAEIYKLTRGQTTRITTTGGSADSWLTVLAQQIKGVISGYGY